MKTIKLPVEFNDSINEDIRVYSSVVRFSYNRFLDGYNQTQAYRLCCQTFHIGTHLITSAMRQAKALYSRFKDGGIQFGDFKRRSKLLISSEEYKESKLLGMTSEGETPHKGNRHFDFDIENEVIVYKRSKNEHIALKLPKLKKKVKDELLMVQEGMKSKLLPVTIKLHKNQIYIIFDESKLSKSKRLEGLMSNRIIGIDLNPNYIGLSILEFDKDDNFKVLKKMVYDLSSLNAHFKIQNL